MCLFRIAEIVVNEDWLSTVHLTVPDIANCKLNMHVTFVHLPFQGILLNDFNSFVARIRGRGVGK